MMQHVFKYSMYHFVLALVFIIMFPTFDFKCKKEIKVQTKMLLRHSSSTQVCFHNPAVRV